VAAALGRDDTEEGDATTEQLAAILNALPDGVRFPQIVSLAIVDQMLQEEFVTLEELYQEWGDDEEKSRIQLEVFLNRAIELYEMALGSKAMAFMTEAATSSRSDLQRANLFRERWDEDGLLSFDSLLEISEVAELLKEEEITRDELQDLWSSLPKRDGDLIDVLVFKELMEKVDELFEFEDELAEDDAAGHEGREDPAYKFLVNPKAVYPAARKAILDALAIDDLKLEVIEDARGRLTQPQKYVSGLRNPVGDMGECGNCPLARNRNAGVRPQFVEAAAQEIKRKFGSREEGIVYSTLGAGFLFTDWELLHRLVYEYGIKVREVWVVDIIDEASMAFQKRFRRALGALAGWLGKETKVYVFCSVSDFEETVRRIPVQERADVIMRCDTANILPEVREQWRSVAHRDDASEFVMENSDYLFDFDDRKQGRKPLLRFYDYARAKPGGPRSWLLRKKQMWFERKWNDEGENIIEAIDAFDKASAA
jgi:hypothetical protein